MEPKKRIFLISLGCVKNLVDSENILGILQEKDYLIAPSLEEADLAIINTCGFIQPAVEETIETIFELAERKKSGKLEKLIVIGCFVQRYGYKLRREIPEVDGWLGTGELTGITELLGSLKESKIPPMILSRPVFMADHNVPRVRSGFSCSSYLKIAEGCSNKCSFCTIPSLRGPFRSKRPESILIEARRMAEEGVREINLIAQDLTGYGSDLDEFFCLENLLERILQIDDIEWIRLQYCHPGGISDRLLSLIETERRICAYLDIPFQHVNKKILKAMGRDMGGETPQELIGRIRDNRRKVAIRTTLMLGFPGETDKAFDELYNFVVKFEVDHLSTFIYSPEKGTSAARLDSIPDKKISEERRAIIMSAQAEISFRKNRELLGKTLPVLVEGVSEETDLLLRGRSEYMAPEVDGQVIINRGKCETGRIMPVRITEAYNYDLIGEII
ncbi:MAG: 30S ribosomal protein S12 methylthiotransferase RimO [Deltaproteobacteria bacterium]|nr:30S ribosomal protein S12 methylthiotransferase RimO [Deltaproteobacteria bacterium]